MVEIAGIRMKNPVMNAAGTFELENYQDLVDLGKLGAHIPKSVTWEARDGNPQPRIYEVTAGLINRIGLQNIGAVRFIEERLPVIAKIAEKFDIPVIINIAGEKLTDQEIRNAVYTGPWLSDAKLKFSKSNCAAYLLANDGGQLVSGSPIRQDYLETALFWINDSKIEDYMAKHQHDKKADELWQYFQDVIAWVRKTFPNYRREMNSVQWGELYNEFKDKKQNTGKLEAEIKELMQDEDVTKKSGIYPYVLTGQERHLSIRAFTDRMKREAYERQDGICPFCKKQKKDKKQWDISEMEADHITPWHEGGKTIAENCQMLCKEHNRTKSGK